MTGRLYRWTREYALPVLALCSFVVIWEVSVDLFKIPDWLLPPPSLIAKALWNWRAHLPLHLWTTSYEVIGGFLLATAVGIPLAVLISSSPIIRNILYPILLVFQSVPKVAMAPLLLIYLGYGIQTNVTIGAIVAFFPIVINTTTGLNAVEPELVQLARLVNSSPLQTFWRVRLPWALPYIFSSLKIAISLAVIGAVVGEFVGADKGLGYSIVTASSNMNTALVFGIMVVLALMGIVFFYIVWLIEIIACPWYKPERDA